MRRGEGLEGLDTDQLCIRPFRSPRLKTNEDLGDRKNHIMVNNTRVRAGE